MQRTLVNTLAALALTVAATAPALAQDINTLLKDADRYRTGADNLQVDTQVSVFHTDGSPDKERRYTVFAQAGRKSLVLMQSPVEKGQKVLMLGDDFWLVMPGSQRPLRITPMQKLLGDASTGDIATMRWAGDYTGQLVGEEPCSADAKTPMCLHLSLQAARKGGASSCGSARPGTSRCTPTCLCSPTNWPSRRALSSTLPPTRPAFPRWCWWTS
jgi:hypothetical protein